jgi:hypothetical protein
MPIRADSRSSNPSKGYRPGWEKKTLQKFHLIINIKYDI